MSIHSLVRLNVAQILVPFLSLGLTSCLVDERPSMEADIETISITGVDAQKLLAYPREAERNILSQDNNIVYHLATGANDSLLKKIHLDFKLSQGAKITRLSDANKDFTNGSTIEYEVVSEDKAWKRLYRIQFIAAPSLNTHFSFDTPRPFHGANEDEKTPNNQYWQWSLDESSPNETRIWGTGNAGFKLSQWDAMPEDFPTSTTDIARSGKAVKLTTSSTGFFGAMLKKPIAAGNIFIGTFDIGKALKNALEATQFGIPFNRKPLRIKGFYKWQAGAKYTDASQRSVSGPSADGKDLPQIYAVLYRNTDQAGQPIILDGSNVLSHPNVVGIALVRDYQTTGIEASSPWAEFDAPFEYTAGEPSESLLFKGAYNLTFVCSSSRNGAKFEGAVGSTLIIDDVTIVIDNK